MTPNRKEQFDGVIGDYIVEVKNSISGARGLREAILSLSYILQEKPINKGILVISKSRLSSERIDLEWKKALNTFRLEIAERMYLVRTDQGEYEGLPTDFGIEEREQLQQIVSAEQANIGRTIGDRYSYFSIVKILSLRWLENKGPITILQMGNETGYSYPTIAKALNRLDRFIRRHSDRRIELSRFPSDEWARLVALGDDVRESHRFVDRSGKPRTTESLLKKLSGLNRRDIAIGGVYGAKHHDPGFDLVGSPRLDLTLSSYQKRADLEFIPLLDAALEPNGNFSEPPAVVVHVDRNPIPQFYKTESGLQYADPIECLLDLHEARLEVQAAEFLDELRRKRPSQYV